jgi:hypothetical protein
LVTSRHADPEQLARVGVMSAEPNGWVSYLLSLASDVATLIHAADLPDSLVRRLRNREQFQGARYEIAVSAIFARLDCAIRFLDEDETLHGIKHVEFEATHRPTGQTIAVEAKCRHRAGVLNERGGPAEDPLRGNIRAVRRLFTQATSKVPEDKPYFIFLDVNAPTTPEIEKRWHEQIQAWMGRRAARRAVARRRFQAGVSGGGLGGASTGVSGGAVPLRERPGKARNAA